MLKKLRKILVRYVFAAEFKCVDGCGNRAKFYGKGTSIFSNWFFAEPYCRDCIKNHDEFYIVSESKIGIFRKLPKI